MSYARLHGVDRWDMVLRKLRTLLRMPDHLKLWQKPSPSNTSDGGDGDSQQINNLSVHNAMPQEVKGNGRKEAQTCVLCSLADG